MIERKLKDHGLEKVIPDDDVLAEAYQEFHRSQQLQKKFEELGDEFEADEVKIPKNLKKRVRAVLDKHPDLRWDDAVQNVLGMDLADVRAKKQAAKEKSGDFTDAEKDEDDED